MSFFYSSSQYNKIISQKSEEISRLETITSYYDTEFENINDKLSKVSDYMSSIIPIEEKDATKVRLQDQSFKMPQTISAIKISQQEQQLINKIEVAVNKMAKIKSLSYHRLSQIENTLAKTGLKIRNSDLKIASSQYRDIQKNRGSGLGGPYIPIQNFSAQEAAMKNLSDFKTIDAAKFADKIERLISLERMTQFIPFSRPIKQQFISSRFGPRSDPITKKMALHQGIDFVGSKNQEIISPSKGKVIKASTFYDYGNIVIVDHGYGITSRYGHLSKILVKKGQLVNKGDILGLQGNTGRSTGDHLHYEVRYKNKPLDPYKFIIAGDRFFKDNKIEAVLELQEIQTKI